MIMSHWIKEAGMRCAGSALLGAGLLALLLAAGPPAAAQPFAPRFYCDTHGDVLPYRVYVPPSYSAGNKYPLIIYLHDASKNGYDNSRQLENTAPLALITPANVAKYPTFMVAPQCPVGESWNTPSVQQLVMAMLAQIETEFNIDSNRLYLTGGSMGGFGTWSMIQHYPNTFAAAFPMSGAAEDASNPPQNIPPLWVFHSADDTTVSVAGDRTAVYNLRNDGLPVIYTEYVSGDHYVYWPTAYALPGLLDWIMAQRLAEPSAVPPLVTRLAGSFANPHHVDEYFAERHGGRRRHGGHAGHLDQHHRIGGSCHRDERLVG